LKVVATVELTPREERFCLAICYGYAPTRAATEAGYSISAARLLLGRPYIQAALRSLADNATACLAEFERRQARRQAAAQRAA
jgi:phage terminase small subunit